MADITAVMTPLEGEVLKQLIRCIVGGGEVVALCCAREDTPARGDVLALVAESNTGKVHPCTPVRFSIQHLRQTVNGSPFDG